MKKCNIPKKIFYILFILHTLLTLTKEEIFNNPLLISEKPNPIIVKGANGYYYLFTSGIAYVLDSNGAVIETNKNFAEYSNPYTWINDQNNNHYIFTQQEYYKVTFYDTSTSYSSPSKPSLTYTSSYMYIASMSEIFNFGSLYPGCLCPIFPNEVIIYGKRDTYYFVIYFFKKAN